MRLVLASGSPRRKELLDRLRLDFEVRAPDVDETRLPEEQPASYVERVARAKAGAVETVIVGGAVVYHEGRFAKVDRDATLTEIAGALNRPDTSAEAERRRLAAVLVAPARDFYRDWI